MDQRKYPIALITDSTCDIPDSLLAEHEITFGSQYLIWGTDEYRDRIDITSAQFYERLVHDPAHPKSSQPVAADFGRLIENAQAEGAKEAVIITISGQLSGTIESARQAAQNASIPVQVYDSRSGGMGLGWQVLAAARAREKGSDARAMIEAADRIRRSLKFIFFVDSLDALHRGGRIGGAARLIGTALNLKPVLWVNHEAGQVEPGERTRTVSKAVERVYELFFSQVDISKPLRVAVVHSGVLSLAEEIARRVREEFHPVELLITLISPVMGAHIGPGALGLVGYAEA